MKNLNKIEINQISGGEKFLEATSTLQFQGISDCCKLDFLTNQTNLDNLVGRNQSDLREMLFDKCANLNTDINILTNVKKFQVIDQ